MKSIVISLVCLLIPAVWSQGGVAAPKFIARGFSFVQDNYAVTTVAKMNWFQAEAFCATQGFTLVSIPDETTQQTLFSLIQASGLTSLTEPIWTSGTNIAVSSQWTWAGTGDPLDYQNFRQYPGTVVRCLAFHPVTGAWSAANCYDQRYFLCENKCPTTP